MRTMRGHRRSAGFSLIEVLVALIIISIGLLGIAKIQALAYASTGTASLRSLAALEAASLASAMRANRAYWSVTPTALTVTLNNNGTFASTDATLTTAAACVFAGATPACTPNQLAAYDLQQWIAAVNALLPLPTAPNQRGSITCVQPAAGPPIGCTIQLGWAERTIAMQGAVVTGGANPANAAMSAPTYTLYVEP